MRSKDFEKIIINELKMLSNTTELTSISETNLIDTET